MNLRARSVLGLLGSCGGERVNERSVKYSFGWFREICEDENEGDVGSTHFLRNATDVLSVTLWNDSDEDRCNEQR